MEPWDRYCNSFKEEVEEVQIYIKKWSNKVTDRNFFPHGQEKKSTEAPSDRMYL